METDNEYFNTDGSCARDYERLMGEKVIIYYRDFQDRDHRLVGVIRDIDGDLIWLENHHKHTGELWRGAINVAHARIVLVSTIEGWSGKADALA